VFALDQTACDDGNICTQGDACAAGQCKPGTNTCVCKQDADCATQDDGDLCNGTLYCQTATGRCVPNPATVVICQTVDDTPCSKAKCGPKLGKCAPVEQQDGTDCDDGDPCSQGDVCSKGACVAGANVCGCKADGDCGKFEDGDLCNGTLACDKKSGICVANPATMVVCPKVVEGVCQKSVCAPKTGQCAVVPAFDLLPCDDGLPYTVGEVCKQGSCVPSANTCVCQQDAECKDKGDNPCVGPLYCDKAKGNCAVNPAAVIVCSKANDSACVKSLCVPQTGLRQPTPVADTTPCSDGNVCTGGDQCSKGKCLGKIDPCDDGDGCTQDVCHAVQGCVHVPNPGGCDDKNPCTVDACDEAKGAQTSDDKVVPPGECDLHDDCSIGQPACEQGKVKPALVDQVCLDGWGRCHEAMCVDAIRIASSSLPRPVKPGGQVTVDVWHFDNAIDKGVNQIASVVLDLSAVGGDKATVATYAGQGSDAKTARCALPFQSKDLPTGIHLAPIEVADKAGAKAKAWASIYVAAGAVHHVGPAEAYKTLAQAFQVAQNGDAVLIHEGVYKGPGNKDLTVDKVVLVVGFEPAAKAVIDCEGRGGRLRLRSRRRWGG
jgi:hypothetical protein